MIMSVYSMVLNVPVLLFVCYTSYKYDLYREHTNKSMFFLVQLLAN